MAHKVLKHFMKRAPCRPAFAERLTFFLGHAHASLLPFVFAKLMMLEFSDFPRSDCLM